MFCLSGVQLNAISKLSLTQLLWWPKKETISIRLHAGNSDFATNLASLSLNKSLVPLRTKLVGKGQL